MKDVYARVITAGTDGTAQIWDLGTRGPVQTLTGRNGAGGGAAGAVYFSRDGRDYVTVTDDGKGAATIRSCTVRGRNVCTLRLQQLKADATARLATNG